VLAMTRSRLPALASMRNCRFTISSDRRTPSRKLAPLTGGAKGVDDQPAGVVAGVGAADPSATAHRPISLKSSTASSLTVRTSPTFVPAQASKLRRALGPGVRLGRWCRTVFSMLTRPHCYKVAGHLKSTKSCDASGLTTLPVWIS
jgi:hypothetical protein